MQVPTPPPLTVVLLAMQLSPALWQLGHPRCPLGLSISFPHARNRITLRNRVSPFNNSTHDTVRHAIIPHSVSRLPLNVSSAHTFSFNTDWLKLNPAIFYSPFRHVIPTSERCESDRCRNWPMMRFSKWTLCAVRCWNYSLFFYTWQCTIDLLIKRITFPLAKNVPAGSLPVAAARELLRSGKLCRFAPSAAWLVIQLSAFAVPFVDIARLYYSRQSNSQVATIL